MPNPLTAPDPSASLGGYEWRLHELLQELNATADVDHKAAIRRIIQQVATNYDRANPGKPLVLAAYPFDCPRTATARYTTIGAALSA